MIEELIADLKREEGFRNFAYDDATGKPVARGQPLLGYVTLGYGFCIDALKGRPMPLTVADFWLKLIVNEFIVELEAAWPAILKQPDDVRRALYQLAYQMGVDGLMKFKLMLASLERGDRETAALNALGSKWAIQTPARAQRVAEIIRGES